MATQGFNSLTGQILEYYDTTDAEMGSSGMESWASQEMRHQEPWPMHPPVPPVSAFQTEPIKRKADISSSEYYRNESGTSLLEYKVRRFGEMDEALTSGKMEDDGDWDWSACGNTPETEHKRMGFHRNPELEYEIWEDPNSGVPKKIAKRRLQPPNAHGHGGGIVQPLQQFPTESGRLGSPDVEMLDDDNTGGGGFGSPKPGNANMEFEIPCNWLQIGRSSPWIL